MNLIVLQDIFYIVVLIGLSIPLGRFIYQVMMGQKVFLSPVLYPVERFIYKLMGISQDEEMSPKKYALSVTVFSVIGFILLFIVLIMQNVLPLNPQHMKSVNWDLAFNTAISYITNTNWQAYSGESKLSYFSQNMGLTVQNFVSAGVGISVLFALIRGFIGTQQKTIGNFWKDLVRITLYVFIPLSLILAVILVSQGVVQSIGAYKEVTTLESQASQIIPMGPAASQIAIKQLGTNGGGFFGANSAFPFENPTSLSNLLQLLSILLIPASLCISFGKAVKDSKQGRSIFAAMLIIFLFALIVVNVSEMNTAPSYVGVTDDGNLEGKETIHGVGTSALWGVATTSASNGSVNAMHDSFTPLSGLMFLFLMQIGEVAFGGAGSGIYGMLAFVMLTVFIAGLMVGRTPEYLGKKVEPFDMKMVCLIILTPPLLILLGTTGAVINSEVGSWLTNSGAHGFSEILYTFTSMGNNNGSAFGGYSANNIFTNVLGGFIMLFVRFIPILATISLAGNMVKKKQVAASEGTLSTSNGVFVGLLLFIILIIGALSFLPSLTLGPISDYFTTLK